MGRTNPTFRDALESYREDWSRYRRALRREPTDAFDALFEDAAAHADAAGHLNAREPMHPILVSMLLEQKLTIRDLEARVADREARIGHLERRVGDLEAALSESPYFSFEGNNSGSAGKDVSFEGKNSADGADDEKSREGAGD